jgi:transcriptional regulator of nitric oxide reductase
MGLSLILPVVVITIISLILLALVGVLWLLLARERLITEVKRASLVRVLIYL